jgi:hypothetical protein
VDQNESYDTTRAAQGHQAGPAVVPAGNPARTLAIVAIVISLTAPFWEGAILGSVNIHLPMTRELAENSSALDRLDRRTADLEKQLGAATDQLGKLQAQLTETTGRANAAADRTATLAMVELVTAMRRAGGFELELAALRATTPNSAELKPLLDQIEPYAVTGVPTASQLRQEFYLLSSRIQWTERGYLSIAWVTRMLSWQRSANAAPAAPPADNAPQLVSQAYTQIGSGDLAGAIATVQKIGGPHQELLADWVEDAKARVAADAVTQRLNDQVGQRTSKSPAPKANKT